MDKRGIIDAISVLNGTISSLQLIGDKDSIKVVTEKIIELVNKL